MIKRVKGWIKYRLPFACLVWIIVMPLKIAIGVWWAVSDVYGPWVALLYAVGWPIWVGFKVAEFFLWGTW